MDIYNIVDIFAKITSVNIFFKRIISSSVLNYTSEDHFLKNIDEG